MTGLDRAFVERWSALYEAEEMPKLDGLESRLLDEVSPQVQQRGCFSKMELLDVGRWKNPTNRNQANLVRNDEAAVRDVTSLAFQAPLHLRHRVLSLLHGVGTPVASALLTVWRPDLHTVIDYRAVDALHILGRLAEDFPAEEYEERYPDFLVTCLEVAEDLGVQPRSLDRALWMWHTKRGI